MSVSNQVKSTHVCWYKYKSLDDGVPPPNYVTFARLEDRCFSKCGVVCCGRCIGCDYDEKPECRGCSSREVEEPGAFRAPLPGRSLLSEELMIAARIAYEEAEARALGRQRVMDRLWEIAAHEYEEDRVSSRTRAQTGPSRARDPALEWNI